MAVVIREVILDRFIKADEGEHKRKFVDADEFNNRSAFCQMGR